MKDYKQEKDINKYYIHLKRNQLKYNYLILFIHIDIDILITNDNRSVK